MSDDILVVGDLNVDVLVRPEGPLHHGSDTASTIEMLGGGSAANTACWLASTGRPVRLVAAVGDDALGRSALVDLERAGVTFAGCVVEGSSTGTCVVLVGEDGERTMLPDRGANDALPPEVVEAALGRWPAWLHVSGYALLGARSRPAALAAVHRARAGDIDWSVDAASAAPLRATGADRFLRWIDGCRVLLANEDELAALGGRAPALAAAAELVTKHGPGGASWADGHRALTVPASEVAVISTVGAGDAFDAGFIDARLRGASTVDALTAGGALAARALAQPGARPPHPMRP